MSKSRGTHLRRLPPEPARHSVTVGEASYQWELRHGGGTWPDGSPRGISLSIWAERHQTRELILDFPARRFAALTPPQEEIEEALQEAIPVAIDAGWVPDSRGRRFRLDLVEAEL
jgi:hypothetical protein